MIIIIIIMILLSLDTVFENLCGLFDPAGFFASFSRGSSGSALARGDGLREIPSGHGLGVNAKSLSHGRWILPYPHDLGNEDFVHMITLSMAWRSTGCKIEYG